jgi:hypothetical protein
MHVECITHGAMVNMSSACVHFLVSGYASTQTTAIRMLINLSPCCRNTMLFSTPLNALGALHYATYVVS